MKAATVGDMTITEVAYAFKVPRKSLDNCIKGRVVHSKKPQK